MQGEMQRKIDEEVLQSTKHITHNTTQTRKIEAAHAQEINHQLLNNGAVEAAPIAIHHNTQPPQDSHTHSPEVDPGLHPYDQGQNKRDQTGTYALSVKYATNRKKCVLTSYAHCAMTLATTTQTIAQDQQNANAAFGGYIQAKMVGSAPVQLLIDKHVCGADPLNANMEDKETMIGRTVTICELATENYNREVVSTGAVGGQ